MNKLAFIVAFSVIAFTGWLYMGEMKEVDAARAALAAAADRTAETLSQRQNPERNTDADADGIFKGVIGTTPLDEVTVKQRVETPAPGRFRQSVAVSARARTRLSEFFNMEGAVIEAEANRDFERKN